MGRTGYFVVKMGVRTEVRAVAGGATFEIDGAHKLALHKGLEAVVNGREGDGGHLGFYPGVDFVGRGMIALLEQAAVDDFALWGIAQTAFREVAGKGLSGGCGGGRHR